MLSRPIEAQYKNSFALVVSMALDKDMSEAVTNDLHFNTKGLHVQILLTFLQF